MIILAFLVGISFMANAAHLEGILFVPKIFYSDLAEGDITSRTLVIPVYKKDSKSSPIIASVSRAGIKDKSGESLFVSEFRYEEKAFPVIQRKGSWYKVGFSSNQHSGFPEDFDLVGWVSVDSSLGDFQSIGDFLGSSTVSVIDWDEVLYKSPGTNGKYKVNFPDLKIMGTIKLKPENLKKTSFPCALPFYLNTEAKEMVGICPQNFSVIYGTECEGEINHTNAFCLKVFVLDQTSRFYKVAFRDEILQFKKSKTDLSQMQKDPDFNFYTGWVDKVYFDHLNPMHIANLYAAQIAILGKGIRLHREMEIQESKFIKGEEWIRVKVINNCEEDKSYGEGWLPVWQNRKVNFKFTPRGC